MCSPYDAFARELTCDRKNHIVTWWEAVDQATFLTYEEIVMKYHFKMVVLAVALLGVGPLTLAQASAATVMQTCSAKYQAAKTSNTLGGVTWGSFLRQCRADGTGAITEARRSKTATAATGGNSAKACKANYKAAKSGGTLNGMKKKAFITQCEGGTTAPAAAAAAPAPAAALATSGTSKKSCNANYKAAKSGGTLNGIKKKAFMAQCEGGASAPAAAVVAPAAATSRPARSSTGGAQTAGRTAEHARQKQCGAQWRANKVRLVAATPGLTWPKYWSACNKQLKASGH